MEACMRIVAGVVTLLVAGATVSTYAAQQTVQGELVTIMCVAKNGAKGQGPAHADCAIDCAKKGYPLAVLAADGTLFKITGPLAADNNEKLQSLLAKRVVATGEVTGDAEKTIEATTIVAAEK
jgi:hypothetical protein